MTPLARRGPGGTPRTPGSTNHGTQLDQHGTRGNPPFPAPREPYAGASQGHGTVGWVYLERLAAKATTATTVDLDAEFHRIVDQLGEQRAKVLLLRRCAR